MKVRSLSAEQESQLWQRWRESHDLTARAELMESYLDYARIIAAKLYRNRYSNECEFADYAHFAAVGMLEAMESFDPARGVSFRTFSSRRIHGAVLDGLHASSEIHRQIWARKTLLAERTHSLVAPGGDTIGTDDTFLGLVEVAIGLALGYMLEGSGMYQCEEDVAGSTNGYDRAEFRQLQQKVGLLIADLPPRERLVVRAHYFDHLQFKDIAQTLAVSKVRVFQLHRQALDRLYRSMVSLRMTHVAA